MESSDGSKWRDDACGSEFPSFTKNDTWDVVLLPSGRKAIGSKWLFKVKENERGEVERFKARLVAKGFAEKTGINFGETSAPVAKFTSIRVVLLLAVKYDLLVHQMDVKTAFLNGQPRRSHLHATAQRLRRPDSSDRARVQAQEVAIRTQAGAASVKPGHRHLHDRLRDVQVKQRPRKFGACRAARRRPHYRVQQQYAHVDDQDCTKQALRDVRTRQAQVLSRHRNRA